MKSDNYILYYSINNSNKSRIYKGLPYENVKRVGNSFPAEVSWHIKTLN
ncbi:hypothetical protein TUM3792_21280 [Shewanella sp. MBTL60-007]|nr:hypothetical protein TUM3792_21280 [Shewanella sp. MBTL60-007]